MASAVAAVAIGGGAVAVMALPARASTTTKTTLKENKIGTYGEVLANSGGRSLYVLSTESTGKLHCTSKACLASWPPLVVAENSKITVGAGVKGKISHVTRGTKWQVTDNGWPVYTFAGDSKAGQSHGEKVNAFGGIWYLVNPAATTNAKTPIKSAPKSGGGGTTTTTAPW
jgi:predicted lipoprotein with Yx(FWY)xxD motif